MPHKPFTNAQQAAVYHLPSRLCDQLPELAAKTNRQLLSVALTSSKNKRQTLLALGKACGLPDYFGANFDALFDCLTDHEWLPANGLILQISGLTNLSQKDPSAFATLIEVLRSATEASASTKQPLWVLLTDPTPSVPDLLLA